MPKYTPPPPVPEWQTICFPGTVRFSKIYREQNTLGRLYGVCSPGDAVWLGQSLPTMVRRVRERHEKTVHCSSCYRIIRGESRQEQHHGFLAKHFASAEELNEFLDEARVAWLLVVLRNPDCWETVQKEVDADVQSVNGCFHF